MFYIDENKFIDKLELFNFSPNFRRVNLTKEEYEIAKRIKKENRELSFYDIIHMLLAKKTNSVLITRDKKIIEIFCVNISKEKSHSRMGVLFIKLNICFKTEVIVLVEFTHCPCKQVLFLYRKEEPAFFKPGFVCVLFLDSKPLFIQKTKRGFPPLIHNSVWIRFIFFLEKKHILLH